MLDGNANETLMDIDTAILPNKEALKKTTKQQEILLDQVRKNTNNLKNIKKMLVVVQKRKKKEIEIEIEKN